MVGWFYVSILVGLFYAEDVIIQIWSQIIYDIKVSLHNYFYLIVMILIF